MAFIVFTCSTLGSDVFRFEIATNERRTIDYRVSPNVTFEIILIKKYHQKTESKLLNV